MSAVIDTHGHTHDDHGHDDHGGGYHGAGGIMRWVTTTNHKDIGTLYLWFSFTMFMVGGAMAMAIRLELFQPGIQFFNPDLFNQFVTMHGLIMVFGAIMPAFVGFANWQIPIMIGAPDMAFARLNNWSFWLLPFAASLLIISFFTPGGAPGVGWTMYAPLTVQMGMGMDFTIFAVHLLGMSSILGSINIITTILNMRAPGMTLMRMPLFCWTWLITAYLLVAAMPVLAGAVTMSLTDRHFGTSFFNAAGGGDPVLYQHIFWFFGHPEVYIIALPAFGVVSQVIPAFSRKPLFGYACRSSSGRTICTPWACRSRGSCSSCMRRRSSRCRPESRCSIGWPPCGRVRSALRRQCCSRSASCSSSRWAGSRGWCFRWCRSTSNCMTPITWWRISTT